FDAEGDLIAALNKAEESDRLKSAFLSNMSHEIRTPMNGILGFSELLKEPNLSGDEQQEYIKIIEKSGMRMLNTINDLIEMSTLEAGQMNVSISDVNINEQLVDIYNFFKPEVENKGIQFSYNDLLLESGLIVKTDGEKLHGIFINLVKNAIKYTIRGSIEFGCLKRNGFVEFFVKDTGMGIPKDLQQLIFERFTHIELTASKTIEGSGLGLSITKAYVELLGGNIWVESEVGKGSVFYFTIPLKK
ncbi:MAG: HAMP domain-containing histidine kinase, partial [Bacteroidetes bacterium]|nr:HAMP domain-containing histidine kinase [Bacteroidota bacterium]